MTAPGADGFFNRIRNEQDRVFLADKSRPMSIRRASTGAPR
jgi:hypothetical protein